VCLGTPRASFQKRTAFPRRPAVDPQPPRAAHSPQPYCHPQTPARSTVIINPHNRRWHTARLTTTGCISNATAHVLSPFHRLFSRRRTADTALICYRQESACESGPKALCAARNLCGSGRPPLCAGEEWTTLGETVVERSEMDPALVARRRTHALPSVWQYCWRVRPASSLCA
jgi:hypothetical protein